MVDVFGGAVFAADFVCAFCHTLHFSGMSAHSLVGRAVSAALFPAPRGRMVFSGAAGLSVGAADAKRLPAVAGTGDNTGGAGVGHTRGVSEGDAHGFRVYLGHAFECERDFFCYFFMGSRV